MDERPMFLLILSLDPTQAARFQDPPASYSIEYEGIEYRGARCIDRLEIKPGTILLEFEYSCWGQQAAAKPLPPGAFAFGIEKGPR
jgi:hypothetical protein